MRIKKLNKISGLGRFSNFNWNPNCNDFKRYNFIYGWNYAGKTSLSRLFRCIENQIIHPDYPNLQFEIETDGEKITHKNLNNAYSLRVYNEDFIEENFKWNDDSHKINPVLILGKESIELQNKLNEKENVKKQKEQEKSDKEKDKKSKEDFLQNSLTSKASEIRNILAITNPRDFDKTKLEKQIEDIKDKYGNLILNEDDEKKKLNLYRSKTNYEKIEEINIEDKLKFFVDEAKNILERKITVQQIIEKLKENPKLSNWVREGIDLHKNETTCQFCGNTLPNDLFEKLNKHFSEEFDSLMDDIKKLETEIENYKKELIEFQPPDKARFYEEFQQGYNDKKNSLDDIIKKQLKEKLDEILNIINEKRRKPFESIDIEIQNNVEKEINNKIFQINELIKKNNQKIKNLETEKINLKNELLNHYTAKAINDLRYFESKGEIQSLQGSLDNIQEEIIALKVEISKIKEQIKSKNIGANKINEYLKGFFSDNNIKLKVLDDGTYQVYRNDSIAKNLSTGEKNILSLVYFFTKLEENNFDLSNSVIFIDDPVSSLDSNHTFKVYGFLSEKAVNAGQVFITTHNFDFFNLLKDLIKSDPDNTPNRKIKKDKENYYLIKKIKQNSETSSVIENIPEVLRKFKSEYNYLFRILNDFNTSTDKSNFELLYIMPNVTRRFLESYLFMRYPDGKKFKEKCEVYFNNIEPNKKRTVLKLIDEYSHEENPDHSRKFPDIQEVTECVSFILDTLNNKDKDHYEALLSSIQVNP